MASRRARQLRTLTEGGTRPVTAITEHISRFDGADGSFWTELDAAMNVALSELPVTLTCFFPELPLHLRIIEGARRNHEQLLVDGELRDNPEHRPRARCWPSSRPRRRWCSARRTCGCASAPGSCTRCGPRSSRPCVDAGCQLDHAEDVVLAVNEVATNAVEHGETEAELFLWTGDELVCEVHDQGILADPLPGLQAPHPSHPKGRGIWIARQLCDMLHVWGDATGTHVRMRTTR